MNPFRSLKYRLWGESAGLGKPVPKAAFDSDYASGKWDFLAEGDEALRLQVIATLVSERWSAPAVLDVGCGAGHFARALKVANPRRMVGIDLSEEAVKRAQAQNLANARFEAGSFDTWPIPGPEFDVITFIESIGYAEDPRATLLRYRGGLAPGGQILVSLFRWGNYVQIWERIQRDFAVTHESLLGAAGKEWDVRLLVPKHPTVS